MSKPALKAKLLRSGLDVLHGAGVYHALGRHWSGLGIIFMLHHIRPATPDGDSVDRDFHPNGILEITPEFLDAAIARVRDHGIQLVSLGEAVARIRSGADDGRRFAAFTIDDGYGDNYKHAWPVFRRNDCPFTIFVTTGIADGTAELWWLALERVIAANDTVRTDFDRGSRIWTTKSASEKCAAFEAIYWPLRRMNEVAQREWIWAFCAAHDFDLAALCRRERLSWWQIREMITDELVTVGAHTINHFALAKLDREQALAELIGSKQRIARKTGAEPEFFCYPYGDPLSAGAREFELTREAGFTAALTTRKGLIYSEHADHLMALPRVSLNGNFQELKYIDLFLSGAPFAIWNRFRRVHAI